MEMTLSSCQLSATDRNHLELIITRPPAPFRMDHIHWVPECLLNRDGEVGGVCHGARRGEWKNGPNS